MKRGIFLIGLLAIILFLSVTISARSSGNNNGEIVLEPIGDITAIGTASFDVNDRRGFLQANLKLRIHELKKIDGFLYEVWLVDEDTDNKLSMGVFNPTSRGRTVQVRESRETPNPLIYDKIVITLEPLFDINPEPSDDEIMFGEIPNSIGTVVEMEALMKGRNEVTRSSSRATGHGVFSVDTVANKIHYQIKIHDLINFETGSHIHGFAPEMVNAAILFDLPIGPSKTDSIDYLEEDEIKILAGLTYVNLHSHIYPEGELRGQILPII